MSDKFYCKYYKWNGLRCLWRYNNIYTYWRRARFYLHNSRHIKCPHNVHWHIWIIHLYLHQSLPRNIRMYCNRYFGSLLPGLREWQWCNICYNTTCCCCIISSSTTCPTSRTCSVRRSWTRLSTIWEMPQLICFTAWSTHFCERCFQFRISDGQ